MALRIVRIDIAAKLSEEDWHCIDSFKYRSYRLAQTALVRENNLGRVNWTMSMTARGLSCEGDFPLESVIVEHLAALRFFYLEKEPTFFNKVVNVLSRHARSDDAAEAFRSIKKDWKHALFKNAIYIEWQEGRITAADLLDLWFNGEYFHGDKEAREKLSRLWKSVTEPVTKWLLVEAALGSATVVLKLNGWLEGLVRRV